MGFLRVSALVVLTAIAVKILPGLISRPSPLELKGTTEKGWERVAEVFKEVLASHPGYGYGYSVYHKGKKVVDLHGGYADSTTQEPYRENTLTQLFSSTKGLSALCVALLVDRGLLDYKKPVAQYWPEFAANGKDKITVDTLLSHQAGLYMLDGGWIYWDILENPERISKQLAEQKPLWEPGTDHGYHAYTIAMYMNELVKRVDPKHRTLDQFFMEEFAKPLDLDTHIGLPLSENYRTAASTQTFLASWEDLYALVLDGQWRVFYYLFTDSPFRRIFIENFKEPPSLVTNNPYVRQVPLGSVSGYTTARSAAKLMGILANGGTHNGKTYLSPRTIRLLEEVLVGQEGVDCVMFAHFPFGRGTSPFKTPLGSTMFGAPGAGGQMVYADTEHKLGHAFVTNKMYSGYTFFSPQYLKLQKVTYEIVKNMK